METEKNKLESSAFSVTGSMQDLTLMNTPLPRAASTATKGRSSVSIDDSRLESAIEKLTKASLKESRNPVNPINMSKNREVLPISLLEDAYKSVCEEQDKINEEMAKLMGTYKQTSTLKSVQEEIGLAKQFSTESDSMKKEFEFVVPSLLVKRADKQSLTSGKGSGSRHQPGDDRASISSANSSFGLLPPDALEEVSDRDKLDLSQRLAKQLQLDPAHISEGGLDMSQLATAHMKSALAARREQDKENRWSSGGAGERNKRLSNGRRSLGSRSTNSLDFMDCLLSSAKLQEAGMAISSLNKKPLAPKNLPTMRYSSARKSATSRWSGMSDMSGVSVASEEFHCSGDPAERLRADEDAFCDNSMRSLSGIYGDTDISLRAHGEKLSISSFLRSGSGPLGSLEAVTNNGLNSTPRPTFGRPVVSPQKKQRVRPILPPPHEKSTFLIDEVPTKDTTKAGEEPWNPHSLLQQFSVIHTDTADVSVPSLSCIGDMLSEMGSQGLTPRTVLDRLMASSKKTRGVTQQSQPGAGVITLDDSVLSNCGDRSKLRKVQSEVAGNNSFCRGNESDCSTRYSSSFDSHLSHDPEVERPQSAHDQTVPSVCDVSGFEGGAEEYVCVMVPESLDFDIFNDHSRPQHYTVRKACYVNGLRQDTAALVHLPVTSVTLQPGQQHTVSVTVAALVGEIIKVRVEVTRTDPVTNEAEINYIFGKIIAELPKIAMLTAADLTMSAVVEPECGTATGEYRQLIQLKNIGRSVVPIKLSLTEDRNCVKDVFHFLSDRSQEVVFRLGPGEQASHSVCCLTPSIFQNTGSTPVSARVAVQLATPSQVTLPALATTKLTAHLRYHYYGAPSQLTLLSAVTSPLTLYNRSEHPTVVCAMPSSGFTVEPTGVTLHPRSHGTIMVSRSDPEYRRGTLSLCSLETSLTKLRHVVNLCIADKPSSAAGSTCSSSLDTPQGSRAPSPTTIDDSARGDLLLSCTAAGLVWGGCALHQRTTRSCAIKNNGPLREKLRFTVADQHGCFKLRAENGALTSEVKMSLQSMETCQLTVVLVAGSVGPQSGRMTISRINSPTDKKVLPLSGFGGKARVQVEGVLSDPEQRMWVYLTPTTLSSTFTLNNAGDGAAFFNIYDGSSAAAVGGGLSISPVEQVLPAGQSALIHVSLSLTPDRIEYLLSRPAQTTICVSRLTVTHGDESTRLRLSRLGRLQSNLGSLPHSSLPGLDCLTDSCESAEALWREDVSEWAVGVLIKRSTLKALRLDTAPDFVDLSNTVIHK